MNGRKEKKRFEWNKSCWKQRTGSKSKERTIEMVDCKELDKGGKYE